MDRRFVYDRRREDRGRAIADKQSLGSNRNTSLATFSRTLIISFTELPKAIKPKSSTKDRDVTKALVSNILLKTPLMYIKKKMSDIGELWGSSFYFPFFIIMPINDKLYLLICQKRTRQVTKSPSIPSSIIRVRSCPFEIWSNTPFTSIKSADASFFSSHFS